MLCLLLSASTRASAELPTLSPQQPPEVSPTGGVAQVVAAVDGYLSALRKGEWPRAHELLSSASKQGLSREQWARAAEGRPSARADSLPAWPLPGAERCRITDLASSGSEVRFVLEGVYLLPLQVCLLKEAGGWKIDLAAMDRETISLIAGSLGSQIAEKSPALPLSLNARRLLAPFITSHRVEEVELEAEKARVKVVETAVVTAAVKLQRQGPFWEIVSTFSPPTGSVPLAGAKEETRKKQEKPEVLPGPHHWRK